MLQNARVTAFTVSEVSKHHEHDCRSILSEVRHKFSIILMSHTADISKARLYIGYFLISKDVEHINNMQSCKGSLYLIKK